MSELTLDQLICESKERYDQACSIARSLRSDLDARSIAKVKEAAALDFPKHESIDVSICNYEMTATPSCMADVTVTFETCSLLALNIHEHFASKYKAPSAYLRIELKLEQADVQAYKQAQYRIEQLKEYAKAARSLRGMQHLLNP